MLAPERLPPDAPPLQRALGLLLLPEPQVPAIRQAAAGTTLSGEIDTVIAAILVARFSGRSIPELCGMGGITLHDFTSSAIYREIFGLGQDQGRQAEASTLTLRLLQRRCGTLSLQQQARIQALALAQLEALADALLNFQGTEDLAAWLEVQES